MLTPLAYQYIQVRQATPLSVLQDSSARPACSYLASFVVPVDVLTSWGFSADHLQKYSDLVLGGITPCGSWSGFHCVGRVFRVEVSLAANSRIHQLLWIAIISMLVSILLMLGPSLVVAGEVTDVPSLYQVLYYVVPGFKAGCLFALLCHWYLCVHPIGHWSGWTIPLLSHQVPHQQKLTAFVLAAVLIMAFVVDRSSFVYYGRAAEDAR